MHWLEVLRADNGRVGIGRREDSGVRAGGPRAGVSGGGGVRRKDASVSERVASAVVHLVLFRVGSGVLSNVQCTQPTAMGPTISSSTSAGLLETLNKTFILRFPHVYLS